MHPAITALLFFVAGCIASGSPAPAQTLNVTATAIAATADWLIVGDAPGGVARATCGSVSCAVCGSEDLGSVNADAAYYAANAF